MKIRLVVLLVMFSFILSPAIAAANKQDTQMSVIRLKITDSSFSPSVIQAPYGRPFILEIRNLGRHPHNFVSPQLDIYTYNLRTGERIKLRLQIGKRGSYDFYSDAPGRPESGQKGRLIVK